MARPGRRQPRARRAARLRRLEPLLRRALRGPCALPPGSRLLVAVSGGADSTALLVALASLAPEFGLELSAAHLHHGLRGVAADRDLAHVRTLCRRLSVPLIAARWDTRARMARRGLSGQAGLRTLRREFLRGARERSGAAAIATAHTADDQLETVLMRLLRGAGLAGLGGMRARAGVWLKPMLEVTRADIEADLRAAREPWREDASNRSPDYLRNRIRHHALPALLEARDPRPGRDPRAARATLARGVAASARELREAGRALGARARRLIVRHGGSDGGRAWLERAPLTRAPRAVRRAALRRLWREADGPQVGLTRRHLDALMGLLERGRPGERVALPEESSATCRGGRIEIARLRGTRSERGDAKLSRPRPIARTDGVRRPRRSIAIPRSM